MLYKTFFLVLQVLATITSSHASEGNLRGGARREQASVANGNDEPQLFRVMVFDNLSRHADGAFDHLDTVVSVPIVNGFEGSSFYSIDLPTDVLAMHVDDIQAGNLFISASGVTMTADQVTYDSVTVLDESPLDGHRPIDRRNLAKTGTRTVAVLRVATSAGAWNQRQVAYSAEKIRQQYFDSPVGIKNQYDLCSNGSLKFTDAGIFDITVPGQITDYPSAAAIRNKALDIFASQKKLSNAGQFADHVVVIIPPNSYQGFVGNAATGGWVSTLNNEWSLDVMVYMHEIGHNLGLGHAYLTDNSGDYSSYMSSTGWEPNLAGPKKCFNAASNREMGWFASRTEVVNLSADPTRKINLAAFVGGRKSNKKDPIIIQVGPYSLQYNYATGFNEGTEQLRNMVTVARSEPGKTVVEKDGLTPGGKTFTVNNFENTGKTLQVAACGAVNGNSNNPYGMTVGITLGVNGSPCNVAADKPPTPPTTKPPPPTPKAPPATQAPPPPPNTNTCPDTARLKVSFMRTKKNKIKTIKCSWIGVKPKRAKRFCRLNNVGAGGKIWDTCQQECASVTNACQVAS